MGKARGVSFKQHIKGCYCLELPTSYVDDPAWVSGYVNVLVPLLSNRKAP
jgi:hypothetical protein